VTRQARCPAPHRARIIADARHETPPTTTRGDTHMADDATTDTDAPAKGKGGSRRGKTDTPGSASATLAAALRELVAGIEDEVSNITRLSGEIDTHVEALNDLRAEATRRLLHLDDLRSAAEDVNLSAFLDTTIQPQLPQVEEEFPERIYGG
jgi:hypothetical protein